MKSETQDSISVDGPASIIQDEHDLRNYILFGCGVYVIMALAYTFWWALFTKCINLKRYHYKEDDRERYMYLQKWASNTHHLALVIWSMTSLCQPDCGPDSYPFQVMNDATCFNKIDKNHVYIIIMTTTYLLFDACIDIFLIKIKSSTDRLMLVHHFVGITGGYAALIGGRGLLTAGIFVCLTEFSTIPLNRRNMMTKEENKGKLGLCNNIFFFFSYTVFRTINMPWLIYKFVGLY